MARRGTEWIASLRLAPHPEGGFYRETYRARETLIHPDGRLEEPRLGPDPDRGESFQAIVSAGCWYGATVDASDSYALVGGTVAPGFDFADFDLADRASLLAQFPQHHETILRLTR